MAITLACATSQAELSQEQYAKPVRGETADGIPVLRGADFSAVVTPEVINIDLRDLPVVQPWQPGDAIVTVPRLRGEPAISNPQPVNPVNGIDPLLERQNQVSGAPRGGDFTTPLINIDGMSTGSNPHDANGEVGPDYFVQMVNGGGSSVTFHDKTDGSIVAGPFTLHSLGGSGPCATGLGDPVPFFDELADRWVLTEFSSSGNRMCFYVAQTNDPIAGGWFAYDFQGVSFPDYPKYALWHDAYYAGSNETSSAQYAFDRSQMLQGMPATMVRFATPDPAGFGFFMMPPVDLDGTTPAPAGEPGIFIRHFDDEVHDPGNNDPATDLLQLYEFTVDFAVPGNSTLVGPIDIQISEIDSDQCGLSSFFCYPQPGTGTTLDPLREVIMNLPKYRNFGTHETIVGNLTTDVDGTDHGGVRWFELRRTGGGAGSWTLFQEGTYAPDIADGAGATEHRWMAGSAMDETGNIAIGFSLSNDTNIFPSLTYEGRLAGDPPGTLTAGETTIIDGTASHTSSTRWGDYASMSVDPLDGCTFWFTSNYGSTATAPTAATRIASFKFDECGTPSFTLNVADPQLEVCRMGATPLPPIALNVGSINGYTNNVDLAFNPPLVVGEFSGSITPTTVMPPGSATVDLTVDAAAPAGDYVVTIEGMSAPAGTKTRDLMINVATQIPDSSNLSMPANGALNVPARPTFSWSAVPQAQDYLLEVATDAGFNNILISQIAPGTSFMPNSDLPTSTELFWRVTTNNQCGASASSLAFSFTTVAAPGDCSPGSAPVLYFSDDMESGAPGWTTSADVGPNTWALTSNDPHGGSMTWQGDDVEEISDQRLVSPAINIPASAPALTLQFWNRQELESAAAGACWDAGLLEISTDGGSNWTQIDDARLQTDPYDGVVNDFMSGPNPLANLEAWCGDPEPWTRSVVDLAGFEGQSVMFRFRLGTDGTVGRTNGWGIDDVKVQACITGPIFDDGFESLLPPPR